MKKNKDKNHENDLEIIQKEDFSDSIALDDEQRIKVLSPSMLVAKRFFRNKLAIVGLVIIVTMFLFSFLGGLLSPYGESQVFTGQEIMSKEYASVAINNEYRLSLKEGKEFPATAQSQLILAINNQMSTFEAQEISYTLTKEGENFYKIGKNEEVASVIGLKGIFNFTSSSDEPIIEGMSEAFIEALDNDKNSFILNDDLYTFVYTSKTYKIYKAEDIAIASHLIFDPIIENTNIDYNFKLRAEQAINSDDKVFTVNGKEYKLQKEEDFYSIYLFENNIEIEYANVSNFIIKAISPDLVLTPSFKAIVKDTINDNLSTFTFADENDNIEQYKVIRKDLQYIIRKDTETQLIKLYEYPSKRHWLGTDGNGMDILTRLTYGGKISLMIGFVVVIIEVFIGVIFGGIAGYFGKWIDNIIMRIVDIFNCIPSMPLLIILGAILDALKIDPKVRTYILMLVLGFLGWPGIARLVRGQILSLREQEFMIATEAMGLSTYRKIFKHLVPNVIPQLIVMATMGLGSIILTEATLSFLGLGVKFPYASWGSIIYAVTNVHVMTNYWFVWIPAGFLILITVLGFNFVGDGLRDAFDPKMKR